jgi:hypothetical protein
VNAWINCKANLISIHFRFVNGSIKKCLDDYTFFCKSALL